MVVHDLFFGKQAVNLFGLGYSAPKMKEGALGRILPLRLRVSCRHVLGRETSVGKTVKSVKVRTLQARQQALVPAAAACLITFLPGTLERLAFSSCAGVKGFRGLEGFRGV